VQIISTEDFGNDLVGCAEISLGNLTSVARGWNERKKVDTSPSSFSSTIIIKYYNYFSMLPNLDRPVIRTGGDARAVGVIFSEANKIAMPALTKSKRISSPHTSTHSKA
jgi:hypothetical protein